MHPVVTWLKWLERQDVAVTAQWVAALRDSEETLGAIITEATKQRDAHWTPAKAEVEENRRQPPREIGRASSRKRAWIMLRIS